MPTNGSFDDVLVRLPAAFRERDDGTPDLQIYKTNLAITEALVRRHNVPIAATDERALDSDLDREIGRAHVCTPVTNAHLVCRLLLEKQNINNHYILT